MQLHLIRFYLLVPLFVIFIHVETLKGFSHVATMLTPNPMAISYHRVSPSWTHEDKNSGISYHRSSSDSPEVDDLGHRDREDKWSQRRFAARTGLDRKSNVNSIISHPSYSPTFLAEKLAQEALGSKEMQDTIKDLASLKGGRKQHQQFSDEPSKVLHPSVISHSAEHDSKKIVTGDNDRPEYKAQKNRKHKKKHKNRGRKHHRKGRSKRNHLEKESSKMARKKKSSKSVIKGRRNGLKGRCRSSADESVNCRRKKNHQKTGKIVKDFDKKLTENRRQSLDDRNENSIEEELPKHPSSHKIYKSTSTLLRDQNNRDSFYGNGIIAKLMLTTTRDPNKKQPGDQGVEYSEYYSENENFLLPELIVQSKLDEPVKDSVLGGIRSIREIPNDHFINQYNYHDSSDDQMLEEDIDRQKRNGHRSIQVIQEPQNSMEYVDSSYRPIKADGIISNERIPPQYFGGYNNYAPDQNERFKNARSLMPTNQNVNPSITNGDHRLLDNIPSQLVQPHLAKNSNPPYYSQSASKILSRRFTSSTSISTAIPASIASTKVAKISGNIVVNVPEDGRLLKPSSTASIIASFSPSSLAPALPSSAFDGFSKISGPISPGKGMSSVARIRTMTPASIDSNSRLRDIKPDVDASKIANFDHRNGIENVRGLDQIEGIASREIVTQSTTVKEGKTNGTCSINSTLKPGIQKPINTTLIVNETKAVASEILSEIIGELEELKFENPKDEQKEGLPCRLTGSWVTSRAGVRIDMKVTNHSVSVNLDYLSPPITTEGLLNVTWNVTGFAPFKRGGPFTLLATNNHTKTLAVFVGACKVCQGIDTIEGSWTVTREPRDCRDFQMSTNIFNEIFRRTRLFSAIKDKQIKHEAQSSSTLITPVGNYSSSSEVTSVVQEEPINFQKPNNQTL